MVFINDELKAIFLHNPKYEKYFTPFLISNAHYNSL